VAIDGGGRGGRTEKRKERKTLWQRMVEQEEAEENRVALMGLKWLGERGLLGGFGDGVGEEAVDAVDGDKDVVEDEVMDVKGEGGGGKV